MPTALGAEAAATHEDSSTRFATPAAENARALVRRFIKQSAILADGPKAGQTVDYWIGETRVSGAVLIGNTVADPVPVQITGTPIPVSDGGGSLTVDGPLTDAQLRASAVPVSGSFSATPVTYSASTTDSEVTLEPVGANAGVYTIAANASRKKLILSNTETTTDYTGLDVFVYLRATSPATGRGWQFRIGWGQTLEVPEGYLGAVTLETSTNFGSGNPVAVHIWEA